MKNGYKITTPAIYPRISPRNVRIELVKDGSILDDKLVTQGEIYNYKDIVNLKIESIFSGSTSDMVKLVTTKSSPYTKINQIKIFGRRYNNASRQFDIEIWDKNFKTLYSKSYNYLDYFTESDGDFKWVVIDVPNVEVRDNFYLTLFTYSGPPSKSGEYEKVPEFVRGGIEIGVDKDIKSGNSFVVDKNPNRIVEWPTSLNLLKENTDWMIKISAK